MENELAVVGPAVRTNESYVAEANRVAGRALDQVTSVLAKSVTANNFSQGLSSDMLSRLT